MPYHIVLISTAQPANNPRMLKEYRAFKQAGYRVTVLYTYNIAWATKADEHFFNEPGIDGADFKLIGGSLAGNRITYWGSRAFHKASRILSRWLPAIFAKHTEARTTYLLQRAASRIAADIYIGHNLGSLPAAVGAAKYNKALCGFDVEDFHSGMYARESGWQYEMTKSIERAYLPQCDYVTFSSNAIAASYLQWLKISRHSVILNVVERDEVINTLETLSAKPLKLVWFSQHIDINRGLETIVKAVDALNDCSIELHFLGNCKEAYKAHLYSLLNDKNKLMVYPPAYPKMLTSFLKDKHIGLASEPGVNSNNDQALSNKLFTYLAAGNMILATDTISQKTFIDDNPEVGLCYQKDGVSDLTDKLRMLYDNPTLIANKRQAAHLLAQTRMNWDEEQKKLLSIMSELLNKQKMETISGV